MTEAAAKPIAIQVPPKPHMSEPEIGLFGRALDGRKHYLEFGAGGSTHFALNAGVERIVSVESDRGWVEALHDVPLIADAVTAGRLHLLHGNIGPVRKWGFPLDDSNRALWKRYPEAPWPVWNELGACPELVLVDGRFRVACALRTALFFMEHGQEADARLLCHDFSEKRVAYQAIFRFFDLVEQVDTLVYAKMKPGLDPAVIATAYQRAVFQTI
jgi:hypothetical protein